MTQKTDTRLSAGDRHEAKRRSAPAVAVVYEAIRQEAETELARPNHALFWSGLAAGLSMGFSFLAEAYLRLGLPDAQWQPLIAKFGYAVGFIIVILGRQQLFTENTLTPVLQLLRDRTWNVLGNTLRLWFVVLLANLLGTFCFALVLAYTSVIEPQQVFVFQAIAEHLLLGDFWTTLTRAIFAGWLIALMVWLLPVAETGRVTVIIIITYLVGIAGFPHIIAGSTEAFYGMLTQPERFGGAIGQFFLPTLIGNTIGGVAMVAAINYAQVSEQVE